MAKLHKNFRHTTSTGNLNLKTQPNYDRGRINDVPLYLGKGVTLVEQVQELGDNLQMQVESMRNHVLIHIRTSLDIPWGGGG